MSERRLAFGVGLAQAGALVFSPLTPALPVSICLAERGSVTRSRFATHGDAKRNCALLTRALLRITDPRSAKRIPPLSGEGGATSCQSKDYTKIRRLLQ